MIEEFTRTAITTLLAQGTGWVIAVLLGIWTYILDKRITSIQADGEVRASEADTAVREQYEKRLEEFRVIIDSMAKSTQSVNLMQSSVVASSEAINQLARGFAQLLAEFQGTQNRWNDKGTAMLTQMEDLRKRLEILQQEVRR